MTEYKRGQYLYGLDTHNTILQFIAAFMITAYSLFIYLAGAGDDFTLAYFTIGVLYMLKLIRLKKNPMMLSLSDQGLSMPKNYLKQTYSTYPLHSLKDMKFQKNGYLAPILKVKTDESSFEIRKDMLSPEDFYELYQKLEDHLGKENRKSFEEFRKEHRREKNVRMFLSILGFVFITSLYAFTIISFSVLPSIGKFLLFTYIFMGHFVVAFMTKKVKRPGLTTPPEVAAA